MTYPPQPPGPYGGPPPPGYGQEPWRQQGPYQGQYQGGHPTQPFPSAPQPPPRQSNTGKVVAIVLMATLLLGGVGVGVYFLTRDPGEGAAAAPTTTRTTAPPSQDDSGPGPEALVEEYITAWETKSFAAVTAEACGAYKKKYGTDTAKLEAELAKYEITGTADGEPEVKGDVATARIALKLKSGADVKDVDIEIKIVKEDGEWRFCGEETA
ncbi:hypothetical protein ACFQV2_16105 [Actinokineospora soli]|uniref:DUF4878 domain-containing protein n=1 Tax=Actinokineospora soli TaxID=1048753 RepID=A0ABW2TM32_9PSEU